MSPWANALLFALDILLIVCPPLLALSFPRREVGRLTLRSIMLLIGVLAVVFAVLARHPPAPLALVVTALLAGFFALPILLVRQYARRRLAVVFAWSWMILFLALLLTALFSSHRAH